MLCGMVEFLNCRAARRKHKKTRESLQKRCKAWKKRCYSRLNGIKSGSNRPTRDQRWRKKRCAVALGLGVLRDVSGFKLSCGVTVGWFDRRAE